MTDWLDTQIIGEATLIVIAAVVVGYVISRIWPKKAQPQLFGTLAAFALVAGLSYLGNAAAGIALYVLIGILILWGIAAISL